MDPDAKELSDKLNLRFAQLPKVVQTAITSAEVEKRLRELADTHKLHLDQWQALENEVMLTLLGFQKTEDLSKNIREEVGLTEEIANALATSISQVVFQPIRQELGRELRDMPVADVPLNAKQSVASAKSFGSPGETLRGEHSVPQNVLAATPPPAPNTEKVIRAPVSESYASQVPSKDRNLIEGDPYREAIS